MTCEMRCPRCGETLPTERNVRHVCGTPFPELVPPLTQRERAVENAVYTILSCWDEWEAEAGQDEQVAQDPQAWFAAMEAQLEAVIEGAIDGATQMAPNAGRG